jgi:hypothetical protein
MALLQLQMLQGWRRLPKMYGPGWFGRTDWAKSLRSPNRNVSLRLSQLHACIFCGKATAPNSTGDHIIPTSKGGPQGAENYLPLCRSHNASKGDRDLLEWWQSKGRLVAELPDDVICAYARLMWQMLEQRNQLDDPAPEALQQAVKSLLSVLDRLPLHRRAVQALVAGTHQQLQPAQQT